MTGIIRLRDRRYQGILVKPDSELHHADDTEYAGMADHAKHTVALADGEPLNEMRRTLLHEALHIILRVNPALRLALKSDQSHEEREAFIDTLAAELRDIIRDSEWHDACGASLMPKYMGDGAGKSDDGT